MKKDINEYDYGFAAIMVFLFLLIMRIIFSLSFLFFSTKLICIVGISLILALLSFFDDIFRSKFLAFISWVLSMIGLISGFIYFLCFNGELFTSTVPIIIASVFLLVSLLLLITILRYKLFKLISFLYMLLMMMISFILIQYEISVAIILLSIVGIILLFNIFNNKTLNLYSFVMLFISAFASLFLSLGYLIVLLSINLCNICILLYKNNKHAFKNGTTIAFFSALFFFFLSIIYIADIEIASVLLIASIMVYEVMLNCLKYYQNQKNKILKIIINIILFCVILFNLSGRMSSILAIACLMVIPSIFNSFFFKDDPYEKIICPLKILFFFQLIMIIWDFYILNIGELMIFLISNIIALIIYRFSKNSDQRKYLCLGIIFILWEIFTNGVSSPLAYLLTCLVILGDIFVLFKEERPLFHQKIILVALLLIIYQIFMNSTESLVLLMGVLIFGVTLTKNLNDKFSFGISTIFFLGSICTYVEAIVESLWFQNILLSILVIVIAYIFTIYMFPKEKSRHIFMNVIMGINLFTLMYQTHYILLIYALALCGVALIWSRYTKFKTMRNMAYVFGFIFVLKLINLSERVLFIDIFLLLIITLIIITICSKQVKIKEEPAKLNKNIQKINYCEHCGNKVSDDEKFCGSCGGKISE